MQHPYDIALNDAEGKAINMQSFAGSPLLIVNVASYCGLTPQYNYLQALYKSYHRLGLNILVCPCDQFSKREPESSTIVQQNAIKLFGITFPMSEKMAVNGPERHALYQYLIGEGSDIEWNFAKFLLDSQGEVVARYVPTVSPTDNNLIHTLNELIEEHELIK